jgi:hypothetical protein
MVPLTFLAVVGGIIFPGWLAFVYVLGGALMGSAIGFIGGRVMSRGALERISGSRLRQLSLQVAKRGTIAVAVFQLVPIAPFAVFNLVAGASHLGSDSSCSAACWGWLRSGRDHALLGHPLGGGQLAELGKRGHRRGGGARADRSCAVRQTLAALRLREGDAAMRVATYNVHDCVERDGRFDPGRIAQALVKIDPDAVAVQGFTPNRVGDLVGRLEKDTDLDAYDSLFERRVGRCHNLLLTCMLALEMASVHRTFRRP